MPGMPALTRLRLQAGLTRDALGAMLDVTGRTIGHWETGARRPNTDDIKTLAAALGVHPGDLLQPEAPAEGAA
jgi:transcriptional regulator with XRE-family HTH domain